VCHKLFFPRKCENWGPPQLVTFTTRQAIQDTPAIHDMLGVLNAMEDLGVLEDFAGKIGQLFLAQPSYAGTLASQDGRVAHPSVRPLQRCTEQTIHSILRARVYPRFRLE
jgi:hypothetical protein